MCLSRAAARFKADCPPIGKGTDHARAPPDLAQDALQWIVGADAPPVLLGEGIVGQRLLDAAPHELGGLGHALLAQFGSTREAFSLASATSSAAWTRAP